MKRMLFNATQAEELRVAIVDGQNLLDLDIETLGKEQRKGNIYKGVITRIEPSLEACFVDYGTDRHGFLPFKEVSRAYFQDYDGGRARIQDVLKEGMQVIVQVEKDERGNKGAALTTFVSLAGRYLVLMPNNPRGGGVSRRIEGEERQELKAAMAELEVPRGMSLIARTAGIGRSVEELQWDFNYLQQLWQAIEEAGKAHHEPYLLFMESSLLIRAIRDYFRSDIGEILVDNQEVYEQVSEFMSYVMPNNVGRLKLYEDHTPLFSRFQIEHQIESAFSRSVSLPSGGAIVIDHTEALVSVDVNSARATRGADIEDTAFKTNMEAAEEVARQMRLRDLGGLVVIDFIDMENTKHQRDVENTLRDALKKDRARVQMGKLSRFGLLELSRQRLKPALGESSHVACPRCAGTGVIRGIESTALHVLRIIQEEAMKDNTGEVHAQVPVDVATFLLNEKRAELFGLEERLDVSVFLIPNIHLENPHYEISRVRNDDVDEDAAPSYQRVNKPEAAEDTLFGGAEKAKAARPEPAVKGVKHTQPAPTVSEAPAAAASWWDNIKVWFSKLFGSHAEPEKTAEAEKPARNKENGQRNNARRNQNRRQNTRRNSSKRQDNEGGQQAEATESKKTESSDNRNGGGNNSNRNPNQNRRNQNDNGNSNRERNNRQNGQNSERRNDKADAEAVEKRNHPQSEQQNRRRNNRNPHSPEAPAEAPAVALAAVPAVEPVANEEPLVVRVGVDHESEGESKNNRRRSNSERNRNQRDRNRNNKKRNIPSAEKIEHYLMIEEVGDKVRNAVAHVFGESEEAPVAVAVAAPLSEPEHEVVQIPATGEVQEAVLFGIEDDVETEGKIAQATDAQAEQMMVDSAAGKVREAVAQFIAADTPEALADAAAHDEVGTAENAEGPVLEVEATAAESPAAEVYGSPDLGSLVQVQTRAEAVAEAANRIQPEPAAGLRRADLPKVVETDAADEPMVQVETRR
ncbi:Rne/Rng family ribonuclease [Uruburuella testudinis]|uniref:Ribonuclease E n=1 Tax=Uruburuella testudinis TaxID=1282863 RepID=A0ABY4DT86_9NEIS|nr:Rne/Rng family ribonuclease [Uruburuella testudinis]UOO82249.1 Rne/Rng family ribonuclease [Uruburuella testudinis]